MKKKLTILILLVSFCFLFTSCKKEPVVERGNYDRHPVSVPEMPPQPLPPEYLINFSTLKYHLIIQGGTNIAFDMTIPIRKKYQEIFESGGHIEVIVYSLAESKEEGFHKTYTSFPVTSGEYQETIEICLKNLDIYVSYIKFYLMVFENSTSEGECVFSSKTSYKIGTYKKKNCYILSIFE